MKSLDQNIIEQLNIKLVILGSDENAYGVARLAHENYNLKSTVICQHKLPATDYSKILTKIEIPNLTNEDVFVSELVKYAKEHSEYNLIALPCGDEYSQLLSKNEHILTKYYRYNVPSPELNSQLENKIDFYRTCEEYGIPYPKYISISGIEDLKYMNLEYPVILKPNDSISYLALEFTDKYKVYTIYDEKELVEVVETIYGNNYTGQMIIQEYIPGPASQQASLNSYVDKNGKVRMMVYGQVLLEDPLPLRIGNNNAIFTKYMPELFDFYKIILEKLNYTGFANIDLKYDSRDGQYKAFEMNLRLPQSHYFMAAGGVNVLDFYIRDLFNIEFEEDVYYHKNTEKIWLHAHPILLKKYTDTKHHSDIDKLLSNGYVFTNYYKKDFHIMRYLRYLRRKYGTIRHFKNYHNK